MSLVSIHIVDDFDDPAVGPDVWDALLIQSDTAVGALTWHSQRRWWQDNQRMGELRILRAEQLGRAVAIAPFFVASGMVMNLCPVNRLDIVGDVGDPDVLDAIVTTAQQLPTEFVGLRMYFVPDRSRTSCRLQESAQRLGLDCVLEDEQPAPVIQLREHPEAALACVQTKTLLRNENYLRRRGTVEVHHFRDAADILPQLDAFFAEHIERWSDTTTQSRFTDPVERESFRRRTEEQARAGWLRFSRLDWNGRPIAYHRGACFHGHYNYGRTTFAADLARHSPGSVLLRHLILAAIAEGAHTFDFGLGDEPYKYRYATHEDKLQTWGVYPKSGYSESR